MAKTNKKTKKTIWLTPATLQLISAYSATTEQDFSNTVETLILKSFDNIEEAKTIAEKVDKRLKRLEERQAKDTDRIAYLIIGLGRMIARVLAHTKMIVVNSYDISEAQLETTENNSIKHSMKDFKWRQKAIEGVENV